jgi:hypothetical protein
VVGRIGEFDSDNRAGLERTLHHLCHPQPAATSLA